MIHSGNSLRYAGIHVGGMMVVELRVGRVATLRRERVMILLGLSASRIETRSLGNSLMMDPIWFLWDPLVIIADME